MPFKKGNKIGKGRPPESPNKRTVEVLDKVAFVMALLEPNISYDIEQLKPAERVRLYADLLEYIKPKLQRTELTGANGGDIEVTWVINDNKIQ